MPFTQTRRPIAATLAAVLLVAAGWAAFPVNAVTYAPGDPLTIDVADGAGRYVAPTARPRQLRRFQVWWANLTGTETTSVDQTATLPPPAFDSYADDLLTRHEHQFDPMLVPAAPTDVVGRSWELAATLATVDAHTAGDLTAGLAVAATGTVAADGTVGDVGAVPAKRQSAALAGAVVMFVPTGSGVASGGDGPELVEVADTEAAIEWLCANGADDDICDKETATS